MVSLDPFANHSLIRSPRVIHSPPDVACLTRALTSAEIVSGTSRHPVIHNKAKQKHKHKPKPARTSF
jgi:hypothetical protein